MTWILAEGAFDTGGEWDDTDVWVDFPPVVLGTEPWLLLYGIYDEEGFWDDSDVWRDGPTIPQQGVDVLEVNFGKVSNRATWEVRVELYDTQTNDPIDMTLVDEITVSLRAPTGPQTGYSSSSPALYTDRVHLSGSLTDGEVFYLPGDNNGFAWRFTDEQMGTLRAQTYDVGVLVESLGDVTQLILGRVSVLKGL